MRIQSVRAIPVDLPLPHPMEWATGCMASQAHVLVRIMTDEGVEGIAEAIPRENIYGETQVGMVHVINNLLAPLVAGLDPFDVEKVHEAMAFIKGNLAAKGGIDVALWDIMGKACGLPCHKLLGGYRDSIEPSRILWLTSDEVMVDQARELNAKGYRAFKVKGGLDPDADVRVLSGGERQALAIGRAMYFGARLVILDEPTTALSLKEVKRVLEFIQALRDKGRSVLLVSHHVHQAYDVADRFLFMDKGRTVGEVRREGTSPADLTERLLSLAEGRGA